MAIDIQIPPRRPPSLLAGLLHRIAPQGLNSNTQFFLVFLGALGLHLLLAPAFMRSAAMPEPGDPGEKLLAPAVTAMLPEAPPPIEPVKSSPKSSKASVILSDQAASQGTVANNQTAETPAAKPTKGIPVLPVAPTTPGAPGGAAGSVSASTVKPAPAPVKSTAPPPVTPSLTDLIGAAASAPMPDAAQPEPAAASAKEGVRSFRALP